MRLNKSMCNFFQVLKINEQFDVSKKLKEATLQSQQNKLPPKLPNMTSNVLWQWSDVIYYSVCRWVGQREKHLFCSHLTGENYLLSSFWYFPGTHWLRHIALVKNVVVNSATCHLLELLFYLLQIQWASEDRKQSQAHNRVISIYWSNDRRFYWIQIKASMGHRRLTGRFGVRCWFVSDVWVLNFRQTSCLKMTFG